MCVCVCVCAHTLECLCEPERNPQGLHILDLFGYEIKTLQTHGSWIGVEISSKGLYPSKNSSITD